MNRITSSYKLIFLFGVFFVASNAISVNLKPGESCASVCSGKEKIFKYDDDRIYVYNFLSKHLLINPNSEKETLKLELKGKAELSKNSACDFSFQLTDVTMRETLIGMDYEKDRNYEMMKKLMEKYPLRFGFDDGRITGVCQDNMDSEFAVNVKKAILSSLQVSLDSLDAPNYLTETDISGDCITEYTTSTEPPNFITVKKTKSVSGCGRNNKYFSTFSGRVFEHPMENRNFALLDGSYSCEIKIKRAEGFKESICKEIQIFKPFFSDKSGSSIEIIQELRFDSIRKGKIATQVPNTRSDLTMNHGGKSPLNMEVQRPSVLEIANKLCSMIQNPANNGERTQLFVQFIRSLSTADYQSIQNVDKFFQDNVLCASNKLKLKNILLDALPYAKSDDAFKFLLEDANLHKLENLGFSFIENASPNIINLFSKKLDDTKTDYSVFITLSSMIRSFCEGTHGCMLNPFIVNATNKLLNNLGEKCTYIDRKSREKILYTLRAIGNAGQFSEYKKLSKILRNCVISANEDDIKIYSIEAVQQFPCNADIDIFLWDIYDDMGITSEIRIQAYLSLIRCPLRETFRKIIQKLSNEKSQQLGSFVWSHISNLMETSDRFKTETRDMLQIFSKPINDLSRKFNLDFRSYSKNLEKTFQRGYTSAKIDSNIIFSKSPIPSSITANITIDLFGRSLNIFEFGMRGKGVTEKLFDSMNTVTHKNTRPDIIKMHQKAEIKPDKFSISMYTRIMGREIYFSPNFLSDLTMTALKLSSKISFEKSLLLSDITVSVSSITGFPIHVTVESAASTEFSMSKNKNLKLSDIDISSENSMAIQVIGKMQINAHCTKVGVQSFGVASSDMIFGGKFKLIKENPQIEDILLTDYQFEISKMPDNKKLLSFSTELSLIHNLEKLEKKPQYEILLNKCTGDTMLKLRGIKICASALSAKSYGTFLPNFKTELNIKKFNGFKFQFRKEYLQNPIKKLTKFLLSTSFQGADKETIKFQFNRNPKDNTQMYELSLWDKDIYAKIDLNKEKVSGEIKYGMNKATISGSLETKGVFTSTLNMIIKSSGGETDVRFEQTFSKEGPQILLSATRKGDKAFSLQSKTSMRLSNHKVFNYFNRFRHSTVLNLPYENEWSLVLQSSKGNNPTMEFKAKLESYWKTKLQNNYYIKQDYLWSKYSVIDMSVLSEKVNGINYTVSLDQKFEVKDKKFNMQQNLMFFKSDAFSIFEKKPSLVIFKLETYDSIKKNFIRQVATKCFIDIMNSENGKIILQNYINHSLLKLQQNFTAMASWKPNTLYGYDIEAGIHESDVFRMSFKHKFNNTQNGNSSMEIKFKDLIYKINSELMLPKSHLLFISWPKNTLIIESKLNTKSLVPFNTVINHNIKLNEKIYATITNTAEFDNQEGRLTLFSIGKTAQSTIYSMSLGGNLKYNSYKSLYNLSAHFEIENPPNDVNLRISTKQLFNYFNPNITQNIIFESQFLYKNNKNDKLYGIETRLEFINSSESFYQIRNVINEGSSFNEFVFKFGNKEKKYIIGCSINLTQYLNLEFLYKLLKEDKKINTSFLGLFNSKLNKEYNFFYKNNMLIVYPEKYTYSITWNGKYGKNKDVDLIPFKGSLRMNYIRSEKFDFFWDMSHPLLSKFQLANLILGFNFELKGTTKSIFFSNMLVKWHKLETRTPKYYELKLNGSYEKEADTKYTGNLNGILIKDSSSKKLFELESKYSLSNKTLESHFRLKFINNHVLITLNVNGKDPTSYYWLLSLKTSFENFKEFTYFSELKTIGTTYHGKSNLTLLSFNSYNMEITQVRKIDLNNGLDLVSNVKWVSNLPYLNSGSYVFGVLVMKNNHFKLNFNLIYNNSRPLDIKLSTDFKTKEIQIYAESLIIIPLKFSFNFVRTSNNLITFNTEIGYEKQYLKFLNTKFTWKMENNIKSSNFTMTILSSIELIDDSTILSDLYYETDKFFHSFKMNNIVKYKTKSISSINIDLSKGEIQMKHLLGQYIKNIKISNLQLDLKYQINSIRDWKIKLTFLAEPIFEKTELEIIYFRKETDYKTKLIESMGEASFYSKIEYNYTNILLKNIMFVNKDLQKGIVILKVNIPKMNIKLDEVSMSVNIMKMPDNKFKGTATYKDIAYTFSYESDSLLKKKLEIHAVSKNIIITKLLLSYNFQEDSVLVVSIDEILILNFNMKAETVDKMSGTIILNFKKKEILNLKVSLEVKFPIEVKTISDYLKAILGIKKGIFLKYEIYGNIFDKNLKRKVEIYHTDSKQFQGGIKSYYSTSTEINLNSSIVLKTILSFDKKYPMFDFENNIYYKINNDVKIDRTSKIKFISVNDFFFHGKSDLWNQSKSELLVIYNSNITQANFNLEISGGKKKLEIGFGFRNLKKNEEISFYFVNSKTNYTINTNINVLFFNLRTDNFFPIGKEYFIESSKKYEFRITRKKQMQIEITLNYDWPSSIVIAFELILSKEKEQIATNIQFKSPFQIIKFFEWKFLCEYGGKIRKFLSSEIRLNKKLISELKLKYINDKLHELNIDYIGKYDIKGLVKINIKEYQLSHVIVVKDGKFKTELWNSTSKCNLRSEFHCYLIHKNQARKIIVGSNWENTLKRIELSWNKNKDQSLIFTYKTLAESRSIIMENPFRIITLSHDKSINNEKSGGVLNINLKNIDKSKANDVYLTLKYQMKGSLRSDYKLELHVETTLLHKDLKISIKREVSLDIGDLYVIDVKASFGDEKLPFFGVRGYLRQLSSRSYEIKLHGTNYDKFAILKITSIFATEEITFEYILEQSNQPNKEFLFQYIPFRKLHLTNKRNIKILMRRDIYQYGYKSEYALKLGSTGTDINAFSTFTKSPMKYYAEINSQNQKTVLHIRPIGKSIIGEFYRKTSEKKILDMSLQLKLDERNILDTKLYWHPETFERLKKCYTSIFHPQNMKTLMTEVYQTNENQLSSFWSNVKLDVVKNINVGVSLEFLKGIANDWENFPQNIAFNYDNDDLFMTSMMTDVINYLKKLEIPNRINRMQSSISELNQRTSNMLYEWIVNAKLYAVFYQPFNNTLDAYTYENVKFLIKNLIDSTKYIYNIYERIINKIGDLLDLISKKMKSTATIFGNVKDVIAYYYKNSPLIEIINVMSDIRIEILNVLEKIMETDIFKQRVKNYQDLIKSYVELFNFMQDFKNRTLEYFLSSNLLLNAFKTIEFIKSMKYKEAFLNVVKLEETKFKMNLDDATIELQFYVLPITKRYFEVSKTIIDLLPLQTIYSARNTNFGEKFLELFYRYEYIMFNYGSLNLNLMKKLLPPFSKSAWVLNGNSILTFDGSSIRIGSGICSYLLARDFKNGSFSIVMNIEKNLKYFELSYIKKITIHETGLVKIDEVTMSIYPKIIKEGTRNLVIYRDNNIIKIKTSEGLVIKYFTNLDSLKVMLTGFWHGSVKGMLGSNDFDKINDWSTPSGHLANDAGILSKSWSIGICEGKTKTGLYSIKVDQKQLQECVNLFQPESLSYLKRCFTLINPEPYFELCHRSLQYAAQNNIDFKDMICSLSRNYVMRCKSKGILIRLDKSCVKCGVKKLNERFPKSDLSKIRKFNYIFIMEQSECLISYRTLITDLVNIMASKPDNIFTLLSHNGKDVFNEAHFKSIDYKINVNKDQFLKLLDEFWSTEQIEQYDINKVISHPGKAIYDAIKMTSISGYLKKIILISCSACMEHEKYIYSTLAGLLNNAKISVTYLTTQVLTGSEADTNTVGIGNRQVFFFEKDTNTLKSRPLRRNVQPPKDACSPLARLNQGFVWSLKPLISSNRMRRLAENIHNELEKIEQPLIQTCYCSAGDNDDGKIECKVMKLTRPYSVVY